MKLLSRRRSRRSVAGHLVAAGAVATGALMLAPASQASATDYSIESLGDNATFTNIVDGGTDGRLTISTTKKSPKVGDRITVRVDYAPMNVWDLFPESNNKMSYDLKQDLIQIWANWSQYVSVNGKPCNLLDSDTGAKAGGAIRVDGSQGQVSSGWWPLDVIGATHWSTGVLKRIFTGTSWQMQGTCSFTVNKDLGKNLTVGGITKRSNLFGLLQSESRGLGEIQVADRAVAKTPEIVSPVSGGTARAGSDAFTGFGPSESTIVLYRDGKPVATTKTDADGAWRIPVSDQFPKGSGYFTAVAKGDRASEDSQRSEGVRVDIADPLDGLAAPAITSKDRSIKPGDIVSGTGAPGDVVTLKDADGNVFGLGGKVGDDGKWKVVVPEGAKPGKVALVAVAEQGGKSRTSDPVTFDVKGQDDSGDDDAKKRGAQVTNVTLLPGKQANLDFKLQGFSGNQATGDGDNRIKFTAPSGSVWTGALTSPKVCGRDAANIDVVLGDKDQTLRPKTTIKWCGPSLSESPALTARLSLPKLSKAQFAALKVGSSLGNVKVSTASGSQTLKAKVTNDAR